MRVTTKSVLSLAAASMIFASCSNDDNTVKQETFNYSTPDTYVFERNGSSSVDFSGATNRLAMLTDMESYIKANPTAIDNTVLSDMYSNVNSRFTASGLTAVTASDLNNSGLQLKDRTAASFDYFSVSGDLTLEHSDVVNVFESTFNDLKAASTGGTASAGQAGIYLDGTSKRLLAANGLESQQVLSKGMMGACFMDQVLNNYLSVQKLDAGTNKIDNTNGVVVNGKSYTAMEHQWDMAYGFIYGGDNLTNPAKAKYWSSYIAQVDANPNFSTLKEDIDLAFRKGRAAIAAHDYKTRDEQIKVIKTKLALVPAVRAVFYLVGEGKSKLTSGAGAFHALSEGYGFVMSLRYTNNPATNSPYFTKAEVDAMLSTLISGTNGYWDVDHISGKLDTVAAQIAARFGFTVDQANTSTQP